MSAATLLLVDDDPGVLRVWSRTLAAYGHRCHTAGSVPRALEILDAEPIDLVVADIDLGGAAALDLLRAVDGEAVPAILVTGAPSLDTPVAGLRLQILGYVQKPAVDLPARVEDALARARRRPAPERLRASMDAWWSGPETLREQLLTLTCERPTPPGGVPAGGAWSTLSEQERDVVVALRDGLSNKDIGARLFLSEHTVKSHLKAIFKKLDVQGRAELLHRLNEP